MRYVSRREITDYIKKSVQKYKTACWDLGTNSLKSVISMSFKYNPSITYLDLSTCEFTTKKKASLTWISWRKLNDDRLEIIYRLDLEDKNQMTKSSSDFEIPWNVEFTLDYHSFPGYYQCWAMNIPLEDFIRFPELDEVIKKYIRNSREKENIIQKILPTIQRFNSLFSAFELLCLYEFFLKTILENAMKDFFLAYRLLNLTVKGRDKFNVWMNLGVSHLKLILETKSLKRLFYLNDFKGICVIVLNFLFLGYFSEVEIFIDHGFNPIMEGDISLDVKMEDLFVYSNQLLYVCFGEELEYLGKIIDDELTNVEVFVLVALSIFKNQEGLQTLILIWRCISNVYLTYDDFQQFYKRFPDEIMSELENIYLWYRNVLNANVESSCPRPLQHYCRCVIRKRLAENSNLPSGINRLCLPKDVKRYLRLDS